ncbi:hypothetical protein Dehly_0043 [Dehalogenimonas lykanthroporepellens BL-DC-9]|nr:hypothetical protein Dehly_0043 [Dehalogenimonas lykanthroporepellens BL-DC-9]
MRTTILKTKRRRLALPLGLALLLLSACAPGLPTTGDNLPPPRTLGAPAAGLNSIAGAVVYEGVQPPYVLNPGGPAVQLVDNPSATDPTWAELLAFIGADTTDRNAYLEGLYMCGGFAQDLHNSAEAAGLRAGWVGIDFFDRDIGHAATSFQTTDLGLVIIDVTSSYGTGGRGLSSTAADSYDKVAYIAIGQEYGVISLEVAVSPFYNDYLAYLNDMATFESLMAEYEQDVREYNRATANGSYGYGYMKSWYNRLEETRLELESMADGLGGYYWESLGDVSAVTIYW